jgi:hypothetical protein
MTQKKVGIIFIEGSHLFMAIVQVCKDRHLKGIAYTRITTLGVINAIVSMH